MNSPATDILRRTRLIELRARRVVEELFAGPYRSVFRGRGVEFDEIRDYAPGDDVRSIDWHATARTGRVQVKRLVEERHQTLLLAVDISASGDFGSGPRSKRETAAELAAVLALSAAMNNDRVGLLLFSDRVEWHLPPRPGRFHALAVVAAILGHRARGRGTNLRRVLEVAGNAFRRRSTLFVISDFLDDGFGRALRVARRRHDVIALQVEDPLERELPRAGWLVCEDAETGDLVEVDTGSAPVRHAFEVARLERAAAQEALFRKAGVDRVVCRVGEPNHAALMRLFEKRIGSGPGRPAGGQSGGGGHA